jgi:3-oxoacyl-[acyl-carrier protein] reductase
METKSMKVDLLGKKALISGGSRGIGGAIALALAEAGASVAIFGRDIDSLNRQKVKLENFGTLVEVFQCDALDSSQVSDSWDHLEKIWGGVDILINNVGGGGRWGSDKILETPLTTWDEVLRKNLGVSIQLTTACLPFMKGNGWGRVITVTSIYGVSVGGRPWFNIAKVAQTTLTKNLARNFEFTRHGITFNSIAPGSIYIDGTGWSAMKQDDPHAFSEFIDSLPLGRMGRPEEVAALALFVCSDQASYLNGASIVLDGGESSALT